MVYQNMGVEAHPKAGHVAPSRLQYTLPISDTDGCSVILA